MYSLSSNVAVAVALLAMAAAASVAAAGTSAGTLQTASTSLDSKMTLSYVLYTDAVAFTATFSGSAWLGVGFGTTKMYPCYAVVYRSGTAQEVHMVGERDSSVTVTSPMLIFNASATQTGGTTVIKFARKLNPGSGRAIIDPNAAFDMIWAYGRSNSLGKHSNEGSISVTFAAGSFSSASGLLYAHGIIMYLAWGVLLPIGALIAGSGWARRKSPTHGMDAWWFVYHRYLQAAGFILSLVGFILGIVMVANTSGEHAENLHSVAGFIISGFSVIQMLGGWRRIKIGAPGRKAWEWGHRLCGLGLLIASVLQMMLGCGMKDNTALVVIIGIVGSVWLIAFTYGRLFNGQRPAPPPAAVPQIEISAGKD